MKTYISKGNVGKGFINKIDTYLKTKPIYIVQE